MLIFFLNTSVHNDNPPHAYNDNRRSSSHSHSFRYCISVNWIFLPPCSRTIVLDLPDIFRSIHAFVLGLPITKSQSTKLHYHSRTSQRYDYLLHLIFIITKLLLHIRYTNPTLISNTQHIVTSNENSPLCSYEFPNLKFFRFIVIPPILLSLNNQNVPSSHLVVGQFDCQTICHSCR